MRSHYCSRLQPCFEAHPFDPFASACVWGDGACLPDCLRLLAHAFVIPRHLHPLDTSALGIHCVALDYAESPRGSLTLADVLALSTAGRSFGTAAHD
eukprot:6212333-Pleurochrysis_carterae.AAC.3